MRFIREHKTASKIVVVSLFIFLFVSFTFGRYIKNILNSYILETKGFYFNSTILAVNGKNYSINNWDGVNSYPLTIDINNRKNSERYTKTDITYEISYNCPSSVTCTLSKTEGVLHPEDQTDNYSLIVTPKQNFYEGDQAVVTTTVTSTSPYVKTMSATYTIGVLKSNFSYDIVDSVNSKFLTINFTNSISYYQVSEAFSTYNVGDQVSVDVYNNLSQTDKDKCFSSIVTVEYDPNLLLVDMTNNLFLRRLNTNYEEVTLADGFNYVKKFSFKVNASSSNSIIFYKDDVSKNYTYPVVNPNSIIRVSVISAN